MTDRLFQVGDKVRCRLWSGTALVTNLLCDSANYPVIVEKDGKEELWSFTSDGRHLLSDSESILRLAGKSDVVCDAPEKFDYPLYMKSTVSELVVEFTGLESGRVIVESDDSDPAGRYSEFYYKHTDRSEWTPCDKPWIDTSAFPKGPNSFWRTWENPQWVPDKPTWCLVKDCRDGVSKKMLVVDTAHGLYVSIDRSMWAIAEPCSTDEIPNYWPKEWV